MPVVGNPTMFSPETIRQAIAKSLQTDVDIPEGHMGALVMFANTDKMEVALATRINKNWSVEIIGSHAWTGDNQAGLVSKLTW